MIYVTGDVHGGINMSKLTRFWKENEITENDYIILLGDFGFPFLESDRFLEKMGERQEEYWFWLNTMKSKPCTFLWIDGNHENHYFWNKIKTTQMFGGKVQVHPDANNIIHLMRGEYYTIEGKTFWTMGGATSIDKETRIKDVTWWEAELPTTAEYNHGLETLEKHNNEVDYILTHAMPKIIENEFGFLDVNDSLGKYFNNIMNDIKYKYWLCGHYHIDRKVKDINLIIYYDIVEKLPE
ncbi:MAG: metallophosphoesterase [Clostridiales bacterium]|nr:metallophosphoesterase [Clostridiales bacterium]